MARFVADSKNARRTDDAGLSQLPAAVESGVEAQHGPSESHIDQVHYVERAQLFFFLYLGNAQLVQRGVGGDERGG